MQPLTPTTVSLDVGDKRIGIAIADNQVKIARPLTTLIRTDKIFNDIQQLIIDHSVTSIVVGMPHGLDGQTTEQTKKTKKFIDSLRQHVMVPVYEQEEAVTSIQAEAELATRKQSYAKSDVDALAATYILEDFIQTKQENV